MQVVKVIVIVASSVILALFGVMGGMCCFMGVGADAASSDEAAADEEVDGLEELQRAQIEGWVLEADTYTPNEWHCGYMYVSAAGQAPREASASRRDTIKVWLVSVAAREAPALRADLKRLTGRVVRCYGTMGELERQDDFDGEWVQRFSHARYDLLDGDEISSDEVAEIIAHKKGTSQYQVAPPPEVAEILRPRARAAVEAAYKTEVTFPFFPDGELCAPRAVPEQPEALIVPIRGEYTYRNIFNTELTSTYVVDFLLPDRRRISVRQAEVVRLVLDGLEFAK